MSLSTREKQILQATDDKMDWMYGQGGFDAASAATDKTGESGYSTYRRRIRQKLPNVLLDALVALRFAAKNPDFEPDMNSLEQYTIELRDAANAELERIQFAKMKAETAMMVATTPAVAETQEIRQRLLAGMDEAHKKAVGAAQQTTSFGLSCCINRDERRIVRLPTGDIVRSAGRVSTSLEDPCEECLDWISDPPTTKERKLLELLEGVQK